MEPIRSFIAIELPDELKQLLRRLQTQLKAGQHPSVKWVDPNGIHLTLKFLGTIGSHQVGDIAKVIRESAEGFSPFHLQVSELGVFPNLKRVRVVWVGLGGQVARLGQLQRRLESGLNSLGFTAESRAFKPHLTLARVRDQASPAEQSSLGQLIADTGLTISYAFRADTISLMKSTLTREGAIYHQIDSVRLEKTL